MAHPASHHIRSCPLYSLILDFPQNLITGCLASLFQYQPYLPRPLIKLLWAPIILTQPPVKLLRALIILQLPPEYQPHPQILKVAEFQYNLQSATKTFN